MAAIDLHTGPDLPPKTDYGIGCIGAGFIMKDIHLVAYAEAGFDVVALASRTPAHAQAAADERGVGTVYDTWEQLLDDERVEIVDIAFPPDQQLGIVREAVKRPHVKGILAQKPVAFTLDEAVEMVRLCDEAGVKLGVNHNMRYDQSMRALRTLLDAGELGDADRRRDRDERPAALAGVPQAVRPHRAAQHVDPPPRRVPLPVRRSRADLRVGAERPEPGLPARRTGAPSTSSSTPTGCARSASTTATRGPTTTSSGGSRARRASRRERSAGPTTRPAARRRSPGRPGPWTAAGSVPTWDEQWFPQAFKGTMGQLMRAIQDDAEPAISGRTTIGTMALVEAAYRSADEGRAVPLSEIRSRGRSVSDGPFSLDGRVALVTGAGGGLGEGICASLAAAGAAVACVDRNAETAEARAAGVRAAGGSGDRGHRGRVRRGIGRRHGRAGRGPSSGASTSSSTMPPSTRGVRGRRSRSRSGTACSPST